MTLIKAGFAVALIAYLICMKRFRSFFIESEGFGFGFLRRFGLSNESIEKVMTVYMACAIFFVFVLIVSALEDLLMLLR